MEFDFLTPRELSKEIKTKRQTLDKWRIQKKGPPYTKVEGQIRYPLGPLSDWLKARTINPAEQQQPKRRRRRAALSCA